MTSRGRGRVHCQVQQEAQEEEEEKEEEVRREDAAEPDLSHSLSSQRRVGGAQQLNLNSTRAPKCQQILQYQLVIN